jgi:hypothetical protein
MKRLIRTLEESKLILEPVHKLLVECIENGFYDYLKINDFANENLPFVDLKARTKGSLIHDLIRSKIIQEFSSYDNLKVGEFNNVFGINLQNELFIRFKKMDKNFNVSSLSTKQHRKYLGQQQISGFPEEPTLLFAGYIPNEAWTSLNGIYLACWNGNALEWYDEAGNYSYEQLGLGFEDDKTTIHREIEKRVALKKGLRKDVETGTEN